MPFTVPGVPQMSRIAILFCLVFCLGCAPQLDPNSVDGGKNVDVEDGGVVENAHRDKAEAFFVAFEKVQSVEEEEKLLTEFGEWLAKNGYTIIAVEKNGEHELSCPHFPPVTPWTSHSFFDVNNLELLPRPDSGG